ncbi:LysR family transcriptional regulator [uncultured Shewanella sp.]|uniref:LysR family transcriptional regulator n=1 Tax=uncultured Shewanella sp. TaxID=173975 RepID=UPI002602FF35|nr:LysR family transcriptional regulator [uncultured Shewanella sp.]
MMDIKLQQLKHFCWVVEEGGFRAASARANRSQAALSTSIKALEKTLGQVLFEAGHKAKLTPFGELCLPKVEQFMTQYHHLIYDLNAAAAGQLGELRIASVPSVAAKIIPRILAKFTKQYPKIKVSLIDDNAAGVERRLLAGEVDLALGNCLNINHDRIDFTLLLLDPIGVVCLKSHELSIKEGIQWQEIKDYPFVNNGTCSLLDPTSAHVLSQNAFYSVENITSLFSVLELGVGVTTLPKLAFPENLPSLCWIPLIAPKLEREVGIFKLIDRHISPQAMIFYNLCIKELAPE